VPATIAAVTVEDSAGVLDAAPASKRAAQPAGADAAAVAEQVLAVGDVQHVEAQRPEAAVRQRQFLLRTCL
jgi:hypothetical protein